MIYARRTLEQMALFAALGLVILTGVFAVEKFEFLLNAALRHNLYISEFIVLFLSYLPAGIYFTLPVAVVIAVYVSFLSRRENLEFVALAAAGQSQRAILTLGCAAVVLSLVLSAAMTGYLKPYTIHIYRLSSQEALRLLVERAPVEGKFFQDQNRVLHLARNPVEGHLSVRVFDFKDTQLRSVYVSPCAEARVDNSDIRISQCSVQGILFQPILPGERAAGSEDCTICPDRNNALSLVNITSGQSAITLEAKGLFSTSAERRRSERFLHQLFSVKDGAFRSSKDAAHGMNRLLLVFVTAAAVPLALLAVSLTSRRSRYLALPGAIAIEAALTALSSMDGLIGPGFATLPIVLTGGVMALALIFAAIYAVGTRRGLWLIRPALDRR